MPGKVFERVKVCDSFWDKGLGLMGRSRPLSRGECLLFVEREEKSPLQMSIHMNFCRFPIKAIWLDRNWKVVDVKRAVPVSVLNPATWRIYSPGKRAKYLIECREDSRVEIGAKLDLSSFLR